MIRQIIFKNIKNFHDDEIILNLNKHINVIIGPKGGGKSTLFDIVAGIKKKYIPKKAIKALEEYGLAFDRVVFFNDEVINFTQLKKISNKERDDDYKNRNDVIYQNDPIKNDLTSFKEIDDDKFEYIKKQVEISEDVNNFVLELKNLYNSFNKLNSYNSSDINWTNTFKITKSIMNNKLDLITNLDYQASLLNNFIDEEINELSKNLRTINEYENKIIRIKTIPQHKMLQDINYQENINNHINLIIKQNQELRKLINLRIKKISEIKKMTSIFEFSYKKIIGEIKQKNKLNTVLNFYSTQAKNHFKNIASDVFDLRKIFEKLLANEVYLNIENDLNQTGNLTFFIPNNIELSQDEVIKILKTIFYTPGSSVEDVTKWLKSLVEQGIKEFNEYSIYKEISKILKDKTKVLVDGDKDYESLSLGQRSIYGLKYKFNKSIGDDLFLDQPEDNLDNETIARDVLSMLSQKTNEQVFIVTHNANIGILSKPETIIIANLLDSTNPYKTTNLSLNELPVNYLEGGREYLEKRYYKIFEEK